MTEIHDKFHRTVIHSKGLKIPYADTGKVTTKDLPVDN